MDKCDILSDEQHAQVMDYIENWCSIPENAIKIQDAFPIDDHEPFSCVSLESTFE